MTKRSALIGPAVFVSVALMLGMSGQPQPGRPEPRTPQPAPQPREPQPRTRPSEFGRVQVTAGEDGKRVYLWGFNGRTGALEMISTARAPEDADRRAQRDGAPPIYREYYFASSNDGK